MSRKTIIAIGVILILLAGLGVGVYLVLQQQNLQEKAAPATTVSITPSSKTISVGDTTDFTVQMNTQTNTVSSVDLEITFNPQVISIESVTPGSFLPVVLSTPRIDSTTGTIKGSFGVNASAPQQGTGIVATIKVKAKATGTSALSFGSGTRAAALSESTDVISVKTPASVSVTAASTNATPAPTSTPLPTSTPKAATSSATVSFGSGTATGSATGSATVSSAKPTIKLPSNKIVRAGDLITGTAVAGSLVSITIQSTTVSSSVLADSTGAWSYTVPTDLSVGSHTITVQDPNGSTTASFTVVAEGSTPVSGFEVPTYLLMFGGLIILIIGFGLAVK
jgi:hypothetical protein